MMTKTVLLALSLITLVEVTRAANTVDDFEGGAAAAFNWQAGAVLDGNGGWVFTPSNIAEVSTTQSVSGAQSLKFSAPATGAVTTHSTAISGLGVRFVDVSLRLPVGRILPAGNTPDWLPTDAQLTMDSLPLMLAAPAGSATAQLYLYEIPHGSTAAGWIPAGGPLDIDISSRQLKQWLRLSVRTEDAADLWMNSKLLTIKHPITVTANPALTLSLPANTTAYLDDFAFGDHNPLYPDADSDGMSDLYEYENGLNAGLPDRTDDHDNDGLDNITEYWLGTKSTTEDSDGDEMPDVWEVMNHLNPLSAADASIDSDRDGTTNLVEYNGGVNSTDPNDYTTDTAVVYIRADVPLTTPSRAGTRASPLTTLQEGLAQLDPAGGRIVLLGSAVPFTITTSIPVLKPVSFLGLVENGQIPTIVGSSSGGGFTIASDPGPPPVSNSGPVIFEDLSFFGFTGASSLIFSNQVPLEVSRCNFENCSTTATAADGGAILINNSTLTAEDCAFLNCTSKGKGGGICAVNASVDIQRCRFLACHSTSGDGSALFFSACGGSVENCLVHSCTILTSGQGAVACKDLSTIVFKYCTLLSNKAPTVSGNTAGLYNGNASGALILNSCILWDNKLNSGTKSQINGSASTYTSLWTPTYCKFDGVTFFTADGNNATSPPFITGTPCLTSAATSATHAMAGDPNSATGMKDLDGTNRTTTPYERGCYEFADTDGDGMGNSWEERSGFNPNNSADATLDKDQDGYTNFEEYQRQSDPKIAATADTSGSIYVDPVAGNDSSTGTFTAPAASLNRAFALATSARPRILLRNGTYNATTTLNHDISFNTGTSSYLLKPINPLPAVTVDLGHLGRLLTVTIGSTTSYGMTYAGSLTMKGLAIRNGLTSGPNPTGGAIQIAAGVPGLYLDGCRFIGCKAVHGGAIFDASTAVAPSYGSSSAACLNITGCEFLGCEATQQGGAVHSAVGTRLKISNSTFAYNTANEQGGAVFSLSTMSLSVSGCVFYRNQSPWGGAMVINNITNASVAYGFENWMINCDFTENIALATTTNAPSRAGALFISNSPTDVHGCRFTANSVAVNGSGIATGGAVTLGGSGTPKFYGCTFAGNQSAQVGGAVHVESSTPLLANCAMKYNSAVTFGGAVHIGAGVVPFGAPVSTLAHCTLVWNRAPQGGALFYEASTTLTNSLCWFNVSDGYHTSLESIGSGPILTAQGNNLSTPLGGNTSTRPTLAFDTIHLAGPLPPANPHILGTANPAYVSSINETYPGNYMSYAWDIDRELRSNYNMPGYVESGCDEWQDTDNDGLPDWFENYIIYYSGNDTYNSQAFVTPNSILWASSPGIPNPPTLLSSFSEGRDPLIPDSQMIDDDGDGLTNLWEIQAPGRLQFDGSYLYFDPQNADSDQDGVPENFEIIEGTDPLRKDNPGVGLSVFGYTSYQ